MNANLSKSVQEDIRAAFEVDETRMGQVWRSTQAGKSPAEIAAELGTQTSNFVNKYLRFARAIETGDLPSAPTMIRECTTATIGFLRRHSASLSPVAREALESRIASLREAGARLVDSGAEEIEDGEVQRKTRELEQAAVSGIYVYTLPHYYRHPVAPSAEDTLADRTLMKIGKSDSDVIKRFNEQRRTTALPEDPWLLRVYCGDGDMYAIEQSIHGLLRAADHRQSIGRSSGTEWFLTSLRLLDALAADKGLSIRFAIDDAMGQG